jgi:hypothetical protein
VKPSPGISPKKSRRLSRKAIDNIRARKEDRILSSCGCVVIPEALIKVLGTKEQPIYCEKHGWQNAMRHITGQEAVNIALELPFDTPAKVIPEAPEF